MRIVALIARLLLGLMFTVFGLNGFLQFIPMHQPPPTPVEAQYFTAMTESHIFAVVYALQLIGGLILLSGRFVPIGLSILGPIIANILLFHILIEPKTIAPALVVLVLWAIVFYSVRTAFAGVFRAQTPVEAAA